MEHIFGVAAENDIEHRATKVKHPWTNGQVERMNRTIKEATVRRFHYESHDQLQATSPTSSQPTISAVGLKPSKASHPSSTSANNDNRAQRLGSTLSIKCRD